MQIEKLERYDMFGTFARMDPFPDGEYCKYTDALARENALIEALRNALTAINAFWPDDLPENEQEASEDQAIARIRKTTGKLIREMEETRQ